MLDAMLDPRIISILNSIGCASIATRLWGGYRCRSPAPGFGIAGIEGASCRSRIAFIKKIHHGRANYQRTTVSNSGFDDEVGPGLPNQFLYSPGAIGELNSKATSPEKVVSPLMGTNFLYSYARERLKIHIVSKAFLLFLTSCSSCSTGFIDKGLPIN